MLQSCRIGLFLDKTFGARTEVRFSVAEQANQNNPVAVDLVVVYDEALWEQVKALEAEQWFTRRDALSKSFPDESGFSLWSWEWIPGQDTPVESLPYRINAVGAVVFARYLSPGPHRVVVNPFKNMVISLDPDDMAVVQ